MPLVLHMQQCKVYTTVDLIIQLEVSTLHFDLLKLNEV